MDKNTHPIFIENANWNRVFFNRSNLWLESYHQTLPARIRVVLGIMNGAGSPSNNSVLFDSLSLRSGTNEVERPLIPLIVENTQSSDLKHYIFLGSTSTTNIPYGYIPSVSREPFLKFERFLSVFHENESDIFIYVSNNLDP